MLKRVWVDTGVVEDLVKGRSSYYTHILVCGLAEKVSVFVCLLCADHEYLPNMAISNYIANVVLLFFFISFAANS